jgi:hypothetical protein
MPTIVVSGALANKAGNGGEAWVRLNWLLGFKQLGFRVYFLEEINRQTCVDSSGHVCPFTDSVNLAYFKEVTRRFALADRSALIYQRGEQIHGLSREELFDLSQTADLLVNISGHLCSEAFFDRFRRKAYVDIDPGFTQFWQAAGNPGSRLAGHDVYFTIGENIGQPDCAIPSLGIDWKPMRPPVVLEEWPLVRSQGQTGFTTVASWRGPYGLVQYGNRTYGLKVHEFRKFLELPKRSDQRFEIALSIHPADHKDRQALLSKDWHLEDPQRVAGNPDSFRQYIQKSVAEFSVAQGIYVETSSGWFSDRTACYLASGKPVLVQDTGCSRNLPVGQGMLVFRTLDEAVAGAERIKADYQNHCWAARRLAEDYFTSARVLGRFLEEAL